jgi:ribonuclease Z
LDTRLWRSIGQNFWSLKMRIGKLGLALILIAILAGSLYAFQEPISLQIAKRITAQRMGGDPLKDLPDGLHIAVCGAGSPMPDDKRGGPCTLVIAGQQLFVFDTGNTSARNINKMGFNAGNIQGIFLTHFHSDHIDGLGELLLQRWVSNSNTQPVPVHGPEGVETVVNGFMQAYSLDRGYRVAHHGEAIVPSSGFGAKAVSFKTQAFETMLLYDSQDTKIHAFSVAHAPIHPAVGYKIQYKDRSIVISGDTTPSVHVAKAAQGVDVLIHEAMSMELMKLLQEGAKTAKRDKLEQIMKDITDYHTSPVQAAEIAQQAQVSYLLLNHIAPPLPLPGLVDAFLKGTAEVFKGKIQVAKDGNFLSLPAGKKSIDASHRF